MLNLLRNTVSNFRVSQATEDANNFLAAAGITGQVQSQAIYNLVNDLQTSGLWSKMKAVYPMVTDIRNLTSYSENYVVGTWNKQNCTVAANTIVAPNGTTTANTITATSISSVFFFQTLPTLTNGQVYTVSRYVKAGTKNFCTIGLHGLADAFFDLVNLTYSFSGTGAVSASITDVGDGWRRITATYTWTGSTYNVYFAMASSLSSSTGITVGDYQYTWGTQVELGSSSSAYQPVLGSQQATIASQMKYNLKDARDLDAAFRLTWSGGWTYSATGATPNGTNGYANTNLLGNTNVLKGDFGYGIYSRTNVNNNGVFGIDTSLHIYPRFTDTNTYYRLFNNGTGINNGSSLGFIHGYNNSSFVSTAWYNNNKVNTTNTSTFNISSLNLMLSGNVLSTGGYDNRQLAFAFASQSLNDTEAQLLNQIVEKYQVALSRGVQAAQSFYYNSAYSNEANTYLYSTQITGTTQVSAINTLINGLKANNLWSKMKAVYPFVTDKWNLFSFTEDLTNVAWSKSNVSATLTGTFLGNNVYKLADTTNTNVVHLIAQGPMVVSNTYTVSVNFKKAEYDYAQIFEGGAVFNLANGTVQSALGSNATMVDLGDGWYRCSVTVVSGAANIHIAANKTATSGYAYLSTIGYGIFMSAPQIQYGSIASPYQVISGTNSNTINQTAVAAQMKFNLVNPQDSDAAFRLAFSGGWTYSTNGAQPNGTNGYADTKLVVNTNLTQDNTHLSFYSRTNISQTATDIGYGGTSANRLSMELSYLGSFASDQYNYNTGRVGVANPNTLGFYIGSRTNSTTHKAFKNNAQFGSTNTGVSGSIAAYNGSIYISSSNSTPFLYSSKQAAFASIGDGLTDAEAAILYQLVQDYQTTLNRSVV
jgi:hypothetical protein